MKNKLKFIVAIVIMAISGIIFLNNNVYAYTTGGTQFSSTNLIWLPWHPNTPNLYWRFYFRETDQTVYCIEPHVVYNSGHAYNGLGKYAGDIGKQISYVYESNPPVGTWEEAQQVKQAVIWALNGDYDIYTLDRGNVYVNIAIALYEEAKANFNGTDITGQMSTHDLVYDLQGTNWVSNWVYIKPGANVWSNIGGLQRDGDNWRLVVDNNSLAGPVTAEIYSSMTTTRYNEADIWGGANNTSSHGQNVVTTGGSWQDSASETATGYINPVGNLVIEKKDNYGTYKAGAIFNVSGPSGNWELTTESDGRIYLNNILMGDYTITEVQAPDKMKNEEENRTAGVYVAAGQTVTYTRTNGYPRGSVTLVKFDAKNRENTKGNATLKGAKFSLCAAEDIKEGETLIYSANQQIREVITDENGNTEAVTNLPIGNYYYIETQPSPGFNINTSKIYTSVDYEGQYNYLISEKYNEVPEQPMEFSLKIIKKLSATDYDKEISLKGAKFKVTLKDDENQVYYSNESSDDGVCEVKGIPYGEYIVEECVVPDTAYKLDDFEVDFSDSRKEYTYTKVDKSKEMNIEVQKEILVHEKEATDAHIDGAIFTVYKDSNCTQKECEIGPTNDSGYAISGKMRTGTYYLKETTFPEGIDPDAIIPGENVTYRNKVYVVSYDNKTQGDQVVTVPITIKNEPNRNSIEITKDIGDTSNTPQFPLDKCEFTATLKSTIGTDNVFSRKCVAQTDENGYCIIENLPYGEYIISETKISSISLKCADFTIFVKEDNKVKVTPYEPKDGKFSSIVLSETEETTKEYSASYNWLDSKGHIVDIPKVIQLKMRKVDANRTDSDPVDMTQGDAVLKGAVYEIYRYDPETDGYTEYVYDITVDHKDSEGYWCAESKELLVGKYMIKEKIKYSEIVDGITYNYSYAQGYLTDPKEYYFDQQPDLQNVRKVYKYDTSNEEVIRGAIHVVKYDNQVDSSDEDPSQGAILRLTLDSSKTKENSLGTYYDVTINKDGYGEFIETNDEAHKTSVNPPYGEKYYPYTIPYGKYTITEIKESDKKMHTSFYIKPEDVEIKKQTEKQYRIEADEPIPFTLRIEKEDADTGARVALSGAGFKIWNIEKGSWVEQMSYSDGGMINEFYTNEEGFLMTPEKILAGEYIIYETKAPKGYYLQEELRIPQNMNDIGKKDKGGKYINVDKSAMDIAEDIIANKKDYIYKIAVEDKPLSTKLEIIKKGEMLTGATSKLTEYGELYTPIYEERGLPGVTYEIYSAQDIKSPDGNVTYVKQGTKVDTIITNEEGIAITKELYPGEYKIKEVETKDGYLIDNNIPNVILKSSENELIRVNTTTIELKDERQKLEFTFEKEFKDINYSFGNKFKAEAEFVVYSNQDIKDYKGNIIISKNKIVDIVKVTNENTDVTSNIDLPQGKYYVKEQKVTYPYVVSTEKKEFELTYKNNTDAFVVKQLSKVSNDYDSANLTLIKVSSSIVEGIKVDGDKLDLSQVDQKANELLDQFDNKTVDEVIKYIKDEKIPTLQGAKYGVYLDKDGKQPLYKRVDSTDEFIPVELVSGENGLMQLDDIPIGEYYLIEIEAPDNAQKQEKPIHIVLEISNKDGRAYRILPDADMVYPAFTKLDAFTGELVPDCIFEITDDNGEQICYSKTNSKGLAYIPTTRLENGKTYYYTEIEAPEIYDLNTNPHPFEIKINEKGEWIGDKIKVENIRKSKELRVLKVDDETGEPLKGCVFSIVLLDENGEPKTREDGSIVYLVENGVTDENGEYLIEKAYYGTYKFTEIEAPEGYEMNEESMEGYVFTIDENSPDRIDFIVTNTGDIAVIAISAILISSIVGIFTLLLKNRKLN